MPPLLRIGTDEAGYGPLLGPLVVAAAVFETPDPSDLPGDERLVDSKVAYRAGGRDGLARVLGPCLGLDPLRAAPLRLSRLLDALSIRGDPRAGYRWYGDTVDPVPAPGDPPRGFRRLYVNPVLEREFNAGCAELGSKGALLFRETIALVRRALEDHPGLPAEVTCDKHGGRNRYAGPLLAGLEPSAIVVEREGAEVSSYRLTIGAREVRVRFVVRGESADRAVALASMAAKYLRELFMEGFNAYFAERVSGLRPTAGYHEDGLRFLRDIAPALSQMEIPRDEIARAR